MSLKITYQGQPFPSLKALCQHLNVNYVRAKKRYKSGMTLKEAVAEEDLRRIPKSSLDRNHRESDGRLYWRDTDLLHITVCARIARGWSVEEASTTPVRGRR